MGGNISKVLSALDEYARAKAAEEDTEEAAREVDYALSHYVNETVNEALRQARGRRY